MTGLVQIIHKSIRGDNTLDLMITNNPTNKPKQRYYQEFQTMTVTTQN